MTSHDDRTEFEAQRAARSRALGQDSVAFRRATGTLLDLDRYGYWYLWSWMGAPIIQMSADVMATQEVIWRTSPNVIIETGVARGGSMIFMTSMLELMGAGFVIGVDIDIRAHNRETIETHPMAKRVRLVEGSSVATETMAAVCGMIPDGGRAEMEFVFLDGTDATAS